MPDFSHIPSPGRPSFAGIFDALPSLLRLAAGVPHMISIANFDDFRGIAARDALFLANAADARILEGGKEIAMLVFIGPINIINPLSGFADGRRRTRLWRAFRFIGIGQLLHIFGAQCQIGRKINRFGIANVGAAIARPFDAAAQIAVESDNIRMAALHLFGGDMRQPPSDAFAVAAAAV